MSKKIIRKSKRAESRKAQPGSLHPACSTRPSKCPQCGDPIIQTNLGGGKTDDYCENCGWPDENRVEHPSGLSGEHSVVLDAIHQECLHGR